MAESQGKVAWDPKLKNLPECLDTQNCKLVCISKDLLNSSMPTIFRNFLLEENSDIYCLVPNYETLSTTSINILCVITAYFEDYSESHLRSVSQNMESQLTGIHISNITTHPEYRRMGYGSRALELLLDHCGTVPVDYISVSYPLSEDTLSFWKKASFVPLSIISNKMSYICSMFRTCSKKGSELLHSWQKFVMCLPIFIKEEGEKIPILLALKLIKSIDIFGISKDISKEEIDIYLKPYRLKLLESFCQRLGDLSTIIHVVPLLANLYFKNKLKSVHLPNLQEAILLSYGLQNKTVDVISKELELPVTQVTGLLIRTLRKINSYLRNIIEKSVESTLTSTNFERKPLEEDLDLELAEAAVKVQRQHRKKLLDVDISQYAVKGSEEEWLKAVGERKTLVSIKSIKKSEKQLKAPNFKKPQRKRKN